MSFSRAAAARRDPGPTPGVPAPDLPRFSAASDSNAALCAAAASSAARLAALRTVAAYSGVSARRLSKTKYDEHSATPRSTPNAPSSAPASAATSASRPGVTTERSTRDPGVGPDDDSEASSGARARAQYDASEPRAGFLSRVGGRSVAREAAIPEVDASARATLARPPARGSRRPGASLSRVNPPGEENERLPPAATPHSYASMRCVGSCAGTPRRKHRSHRS